MAKQAAAFRPTFSAGCRPAAAPSHSLSPESAVLRGAMWISARGSPLAPIHVSHPSYRPGQLAPPLPRVERIQLYHRHLRLGPIRPLLPTPARTRSLLPFRVPRASLHRLEQWRCAPVGKINDRSLKQQWRDVTNRQGKSPTRPKKLIMALSACSIAVMPSASFGFATPRRSSSAAQRRYATRSAQSFGSGKACKASPRQALIFSCRLMVA
jgi:hypothetical protein